MLGPLEEETLHTSVPSKYSCSLFARSSHSSNISTCSVILPFRKGCLQGSMVLYGRICDVIATITDVEYFKRQILFTPVVPVTVSDLISI